MYIDIDNSKPSRKVRIYEVRLRLSDQFGCPYLIYTTRGHSEECHRFRVLMPVDREINRAEARRIAIYMNKVIMSGQADTSVYDPTDFIYTPPHAAIFYRRYEGQELDVSELLAKADDLLASEPHLIVAGSSRGAASSME